MSVSSFTELVAYCRFLVGTNIKTIMMLLKHQQENCEVRGSNVVVVVDLIFSL